MQSRRFVRSAFVFIQRLISKIHINDLTAIRQWHRTASIMLQRLLKSVGFQKFQAVILYSEACQTYVLRQLSGCSVFAEISTVKDVT